MKYIFVIAALFYFHLGKAQSAYRPGDLVSPITFTKVLNASDPARSLDKLKGKIVILDFFGTWCVPCIRALPVLAKIQQAHAEVSVVLLSVEEEGAVRSFLAKRPEVSFPVVLDEGQVINALFQPPSLPYTVVLDRKGKVLAITEAQEITEANLSAWLAGEVTGVAAATALATGPANTGNSFARSANSTVRLSQELVYAAKTGSGAEPFINRLRDLRMKTLTAALVTDNEKKAFWINVYNGFTQYFLRRNPAEFSDRAAFYKNKRIDIGGKLFSLDDIEHGILRHSKVKWSLGYLQNLFPGKTEKALRVGRLDYRLHFALNCGAKSCPPVAFYTPERLDEQLSLATNSYLGSEVEIKDGTAYVPAILGWFRHDFGGKKGIRKLLQKVGFTAVNDSTPIAFADYNWDLYLDNYKNL